jgi:MFS family permease
MASSWRSRERSPTKPGDARSAALRFVVLIGVVSGLSDMTHEGARSITGPFLGSLHASAAVIAAVAGFGEFLGYALRFLAGYAADRSRRYWTVTFIGYWLQMAAVPLLALAWSWPAAALLIIAERVGRAIRNPARDAMLAHATGELGHGWVFGLREALDAGGAMVGPLLVGLVIYLHGGFREAFAFLAIPASLTLVMLAVTRREYPAPADLEVGASPPTGVGLPRAYWTYLLAMGLVALGYADFPLIAYHFARSHVVSTAGIPVFYSAAMATEAVAALVLGRLFDRVGLLTVAAATALTAAFAPLVFYGNAPIAILGVVIWGIGMAAQESIVKAVITRMVPAHRRASAYGLFDSFFGVFWFAGSAVLGVLYGRSIAALVAFSVGVQLAAIPLLLVTWRRLPGSPAVVTR